MMKLLTAHSLTVRDTFQPESMALNLSERQSTATITVGPAAPSISVGDWIQDDTAPGKDIVWRVKTVDTQYDTDTRTIQLEHMIASLKDRLMFGEVTPETMGGGSTCTARQAVEYILGRQSDWTLNLFAYGSVSNPYSFNGDSLMNALETVSSSLDDCWWSYSFATYPFKLNITVRTQTLGTELRLSRNIQSAKYSIDKSRMYTRFYPIGKNNLHITGDYVSRNENLYGTICKTETDQSKDSEAELLRWANERIKNHCDPAVTVTVQAIDLSDETGETLDTLRLGAMCRMPIPGLPSPIQQTITKISWPNKIAEPKRATVTMANIQEDVASIVNNMIKSGSGGGGGRAAAKNAEEDHAWFVDTTDHVAMIAEGIAGEGAATDWSRVAQLLVDGKGIHQRVTKAQDDIITAFSEIDASESRIMLTVQDTLDDFYTQIIQEASSIVIRTGDSTKTYKSMTAPTGTQQDPLVDGDVWFQGEGEFTWGEAGGKTWLEDVGKTWAEAVTSKAYRYNGVSGQWEKVLDSMAILQDSRIEQTKESIKLTAGRVDVIDQEAHVHYAELKVNADNIMSTVTDHYNQVTSSITQEANRISLVVEGYGANAHIKPAQIVAAINDGASSILISADHINLDGYVKASDITTQYLASKISEIGYLQVNTLKTVALYIGNSDVETAINSLEVRRDGNEYRIWGTRFNGQTIMSAAFSRATTLSGAWSSGALTVTASPQGNTYRTGLGVASGQAYRDGDQLKVPVYASIPGGSVATGYDAWINWKNLLTSHSSCVGGINVYSNQKITLYYKYGEDTYRSAGNYYWYYRSSSYAAPTTYYS